MSINRRGLLGAAAALPVAASGQTPGPSQVSLPPSLSPSNPYVTEAAKEQISASISRYDAETREIARLFHDGGLPEPTEDDLQVDYGRQCGVLPSVDCLRSVSTVNKVRMTDDVLLRQRLLQEKAHMRRAIMRRIGLTKASEWMRLRAMV